MYTFGKVKVGVYELMWCVSSSGAEGSSGAKKENTTIVIYLLNMTYCNYGEPPKHNPQPHTQTLFLSLHSWVQTITLSIPSSVQSEFIFSSIPMTALVRLVFIHSWQHNCGSKDKTWRPQKDAWRHCSVYLRRKTTTGAIYPWQQGVILRLNVDPRQSGCILIRNEKCWYK